MTATITTAQPDEFQEIADLWEASVRATHHFLSEPDIHFFKPLVRDSCLAAVELRCARNEAGGILGFVGVADSKIEMLFVAPSHFGQGIGTLLLHCGIDVLGATLVDVNEQNSRALGFYEHHGFETIGRSPLDGTGKPYPLLHMRLRPETKEDPMRSPALIPDDIAATLRGLADSPVILAAMVREIPAARLGLKRRPGFWSPAGHVAHLAQVQPMLAQRVRRILDEDNPEFVPFFPAKDGKEGEAPLPSVEQSLAAFAAGRRAILELLQGATPEDWRRAAVHPEYETYGLAILARHILMHDHWHMYRMEEVWLTREAYLQPAGD